MRLFQASDTIRLAGLTKAQLREWSGTGRRRLLAPDQEAAGPGRHALYSWRTIIALSVLRTLQADFGVELKTWAPGVARFRAQLDVTSFPSLWGKLVWCASPRELQLMETLRAISGERGLVFPLDPHLEAIGSTLSEKPPLQFTLFPARAVSP